MTTKRILFCFSILGGLVPLFMWLDSKAGILLAVISSFIGIGLLFYAAFREKAHGDKSERVSRGTVATIICVFGGWAVFVIYRASLR